MSHARNISSFPIAINDHVKKFDKALKEGTFTSSYFVEAKDDVKKQFKKSDNKIEWIKSYIEELHTTFSNKLNCIGNLMFISGSHNASIGNKPSVKSTS